MDSKFEPKQIGNIFKKLNIENSGYLMGLSLASNDLVINLDTFKHYPESESKYFFCSSISILRELAHLVSVINESSLDQQYSKHTKDLFEKLKTELVPYHDESLTKSTLKPIRDFTYHYNFKKLKDNKVISSMVENLQKLDTIEIGLNPNETSVLGQRYLFADTFRAQFIDHYLSKDIVLVISTISVDIINFLDSLIYDLTRKMNDEKAL